MGKGTPLVGTTLGSKYRLTRELGRGGMGAVFEAQHVATGRRVAVKVMRAAHADDEGERAAVARFQREALAVGRLETRHVVQVYDAGTDEATGQPYIAMELLEGEDVSQLIKRLGPLRPDLAAAIVAQACVGLAKAHDAGVVHRDIKPSNLFLTRDEYGNYTVKVLDFGIAKVRKSDDAINAENGTLTETGTLVGSPHYMSPEQAKGLKTVDARADIWSLGVVLHKCLSGRTPFDGFSTLGQVIVAVCSEEPVSVQEHAPWVDPSISAIVKHALRRDVTQRIQCALDFATFLEPHMPASARITEEMLVPLSDVERAMVMPRRSDLPTATPNAGSGSFGSKPMIGALPSSANAILMHPGPSSGSLPQAAAEPPTSATFSTTEVSPPPSRRGRVLLGVFLGLAAIGVAAIGATKLRAPAAVATSPAEPSATAVPDKDPPKDFPPAPTATAAPTPASRTEKLTVGPSGVTVEVDGKSVPVEGGAIVLTGSLGSVHKVRVKLGPRDVKQDVILTENGAMPAQVLLSAAAANPVVPAAQGAKPTAAAPAPKTNPTPAKTGTSFDSRFE